MATTPQPLTPRPAGDLRRESMTMALYVAICLLAALIAVDDDLIHQNAIVIVWGTALGLAFAHWFAFNLSARHAMAAKYGHRDDALLAAQMAGAAFVAGLTSIPIILWPKSAEFDIARLFLAVFIGTIAYGVQRRSGRSRIRGVLYALWIVLVAVTVASLKNILSGH